MLNRFNVRVYGLLVHNKKVLVSNETFGPHQLTKFPGGGLQFGESPIDCLKREFSEELNVSITSTILFHVVEDCIESAFDAEEQIIAIYYLVKTSSTEFGKTEHQIKWENIENHAIEFTFPQDKRVFHLLCQHLLKTEK